MHAQTLRNSDGPAEIPSADYAGSQYVDSRGCVFIRAGYGGTVVWVPRVSRERKLVCGFEPSVQSSTVVPPAPIGVPVAANSTVSAPVRSEIATVNVVAPRRTGMANAPMPDGFRPAWTDGRLNENRGPKTATGDAQMLLVWTNTVPRRLVEMN